jgi:hypothetical protein
MAHMAQIRTRPIIKNLGVSLLFIEFYYYMVKKAEEYNPCFGGEQERWE